jgi:phage-related protein
MLPSLPIFHISPPFPPGIAYFFLEFIKKLIAGIVAILSNIAGLISAIIQGITSFISYIVQSIFDLIKSIIEALIPNIDRTVTLAATILTFSKKITQMAVVSLLGWLVGPGIIINIAAREIGLVA